jgi:predicted RNase H-like nuclease (RuvC/YqgF family)
VRKNHIRKCPEELRCMALERMKSCANITALAKELGLSRSALYKWKWQEEDKEEGGPPVRNLRKKIQELERVLAGKTLEVDFFKGALQKIEARRQRSGSSGGTASTTKSGR